MIDIVKNANRIQIIGDAGRGKTTLAQEMALKLNLPIYSTDDFYWKTKFTEQNYRDESIKKIEQIYKNDKWIMEGGTTHLFKPGLDNSDIIIRLKFGNILFQWFSLIKRNLSRDNESVMQLIKFLIYITRKRFNIGYRKTITNEELLRPYLHKTIELGSYKEIMDFTKEL